MDLRCSLRLGCECHPCRGRSEGCRCSPSLRYTGGHAERAKVSHTETPNTPTIKPHPLSQRHLHCALHFGCCMCQKRHPVLCISPCCQRHDLTPHVPWCTRLQTHLRTSSSPAHARGSGAPSPSCASSQAARDNGGIGTLAVDLGGPPYVSVPQDPLLALSVRGEADIVTGDDSVPTKTPERHVYSIPCRKPSTFTPPQTC